MTPLIPILALIFTHACAQAATPQEVFSECKTQMALGVCITRQEKSTIAPTQTMLISGVGRVSYSAYLDYFNLYNEKNPSDPAMCELALQYMTLEPGGDHDKVARALWTPKNSPNLISEKSKWIEFFVKTILMAASILISIKYILPINHSKR
jgi:hypothetical protein